MIRSMNVRKHAVIITLFVAWVVGSCDKTAMSVAIIPIAKDYGLDAVQSGFILSSFFLSYTIVTLFGGLIAHRYGSRLVLTTIMVLWSLFTGITGLAWSFHSFVAVRFLFGAAEGGFAPASSVAIAELYPKHQRGRAKSFVVSAAQVGIAIGTFSVAAFISTVGWRYAFLAYAVVGVLISICFYVVFNNDAARYNKDPSRIRSNSSLLDALKNRLVWRLLIIQFAMGTFYFGLSSWLPSYWVQSKGISFMQMGSFTAVSCLTAFVVQNISGLLLDQYFTGKEGRLICFNLAVSGLAVTGIYLVSSVKMAFAFQIIATTGVAVVSPAVFTLALKYVPEDLIGTVSGIANFGQQLAGTIAPLLFGYFIYLSNGSYSLIFGFVVMTVIVAFIAAATMNTRTVMVSQFASRTT